MTKAEIAKEKKEARMRAELERVQQLRLFEQEAVRRAGGHGPVCGIDEAGRGPLAGPVAAAAVILPEDLVLPYLNDSKKVTEKRREVLYDQIREQALAWAVIMVPPDRIDEINILQATYEAMRGAVRQLSVRPGVLVNDAVTIPGIDILQVPVIKGDARCISIAAASILAKVTRDRYMKKMDAQYPVYGFAGHKGYGTKAHCEAILEYGPSPIHRMSFLGKILEGSPWQTQLSATGRGQTGTMSLHKKDGQAASGQSARTASDPGLQTQDRRGTGRLGEEAAARYLAQHGVRILARNFHDRDGEIDLIGEEAGTLVFFEVKTRTNPQCGDPAEAVTPAKQQSICRTALYYLHRTGRDLQRPMRFDVVCVTEEGIRWIRDAFPFRS